MDIREWFDRRQRMRAEAQDEAISMLGDHGDDAELAIEHELARVAESCGRRAMLKMAKTKLARLRRQRRPKTRRAT